MNINLPRNDHLSSKLLNERTKALQIAQNSLAKEQERASKVCANFRMNSDLISGYCTAYGCISIDHVAKFIDKDELPPIVDDSGPSAWMEYLEEGLIKAIYDQLPTGALYDSLRFDADHKKLINDSSHTYIQSLQSDTGLRVVDQMPKKKDGSADFYEGEAFDKLDSIIDLIENGPSKTGDYLFSFRKPGQHLKDTHIVHINMKQGVIADGGCWLMWKIPRECRDCFKEIVKDYLKKAYQNSFTQFKVLAVEKASKETRWPAIALKISLRVRILFAILQKEGFKKAGLAMGEMIATSSGAKAILKGWDALGGYKESILAFFSRSKAQEMLYDACKKGDKARIASAIKYGANPNQEFLKELPVITAIEKGDLELITFLIDHGAKPNDVLKKVLLSWPLFNIKMAELAIARGADVTQFPEKIQLQLNIACEEGNAEIVHFLLRVGGNFVKECLTKQYMGMYPLTAAIYSNKIEFIKQIADEIEKLQLNKNELEEIYIDALATACCFGSSPVVDFMLERVPNLNLSSSKHLKNKNLLLQAVKSCDAPLVQKLISKGAQVESSYVPEEVRSVFSDIDHRPMAAACFSSDESIVKLLLQAGAKPGPRDLFLVCATRDKHEEQLRIVESLVKAGVDPADDVCQEDRPLLLQVIQSQSAEVMKYLFTCQPKLEESIHFQPKTPNVPSLATRLLRENLRFLSGASVIMNLSDPERAKLAIEAFQAQLAIFELLTSKGAKLNESDRYMKDCQHFQEFQEFYKKEIISSEIDSNKMSELIKNAYEKFRKSKKKEMESQKKQIDEFLL